MGLLKLCEKGLVVITKRGLWIISYVRRHLTKRHVEEAAPSPFAMPLEDAIYNVRSNCSPSTENSCTNVSKPNTIEMFMEKPTGVAHFLPKFLPVGVKFALLSRGRATPALSDIHRHVAIAGLHRWRRGLISAHSTLVVHDCNITSRENPFQAGAFVPSFCPVGIHELGNDDAVVGQNGEITGI